MSNGNTWSDRIQSLSQEELQGFLTPDEKSRWMTAIAEQLPDDFTPVGEVLTDEGLRELLSRVLDETRGADQ